MQTCVLNAQMVNALLINYAPFLKEKLLSHVFFVAGAYSYLSVVPSGKVCSGLYGVIGGEIRVGMAA